MDQYVGDGTIDLSYVYEPYIDAGRIDRELYGVSLGINAPAVIYNYEILKMAGLERPDVDWTWDDLVEMAIEIYQKTGVKTVPFFSTSPIFGFENWVRQTGGSFFSDNGQSLGFSRSELLKEYFQIQLKLLNAGALSNVDRAFGLIKDEKEPFEMEESWINFIWSNEFVNIKKKEGLPLELFLLPRIENSKRPGIYLKPSMFFSITAGSGNERECAEFINFFIHNQQSNKILMGDRGVPIVETVREAMRETIDEDLKKVFNYIALVRDGNFSPIDPPDPPEADQVKNLFKKITISVLKEEISPEKGADDFIRQANLILSNKGF